MKALVRNAVATWPDQLTTLLGSERADRLIRRFDTLSLVQEALA